MGKKTENVFQEPHTPDEKGNWAAHRLEGKVKNQGIKNTRKSPQEKSKKKS